MKKALFWLIANNPLYKDLDKEAIIDNLEEYPVSDCPFATRDLLQTNSANNQGSSYTSYADQANAELFENLDTFELTSTTLVDADNVESTYKQRKLAALQTLKKQETSFVKFPSGNTPLSMSKNPKVFGWLWPTLFLYSVGFFGKNSSVFARDLGFREVDTLTHVQHLLTIADRHFQVHKSFIFIMNNIIQRRQSSFKCRLATNRSWFPVMKELIQHVDTDTMASYQAKLE